STESAPMAIARMWQSKDSTNMGVPVPGVELKLVPSEGKLEVRLRGPNIMPGYWRQHDLTAQAFDDEGFYKLGDALKFEDPTDPRAGLLFDGRVAEDFKLTTGTWVNVGPLRPRLPRHPRRRAALARCRRDDRQGLDQSARGARAPRRSRDRALCARAVAARARARRRSVMMAGKTAGLTATWGNVWLLDGVRTP